MALQYCMLQARIGVAPNVVIDLMKVRGFYQVVVMKFMQLQHPVTWFPISNNCFLNVVSLLVDYEYYYFSL